MGGNYNRKSLPAHLARKKKDRAILARVIRSKRKKMRLTQPQFARILGVTIRTVQNWEAASTRPRARDLDNIFPNVEK